MRLIDADNLKERVPNAIIEDEHILEIIDEVPTAYNVDKVVEKLERCQLSNKGEYKHLNIPIVKAVDIVKEGGINDRREQEEVLSRK